MKSCISILIALLFCLPISWGQKKKLPRKRHADTFIFLEDGNLFKGLLFETQDDAILLMPFRQLHKSKGQYFLLTSSRPIRIPISRISRILIKPNSYARGYKIGMLVGAGAALGFIAATDSGGPDFLHDYTLFNAAPVILVGTFAIAPIVGTIYRANGRVEMIMYGNQEYYSKNRELLDSFIYFPNTNPKIFKPKPQELIDIPQIK